MEEENDMGKSNYTARLLFRVYHRRGVPALRGIRQWYTFRTSLGVARRFLTCEVCSSLEVLQGYFKATLAVAFRVILLCRNQQCNNMDLDQVTH